MASTSAASATYKDIHTHTHTSINTHMNIYHTDYRHGEIHKEETEVDSTLKDGNKQQKMTLFYVMITSNIGKFSRAQQ